MDKMVAKRYLWEWCWLAMSQCLQVEGNCDKCQYKRQALERKRKKIEKFEKEED